MVTMKEQLVTFDTAKLAKEKGFDIDCYHAYDKDNKLIECTSSTLTGKVVKFSASLIRTLSFYDKPIECHLAPTQSLLQKWLREKHNIEVTCYKDKDGQYSVSRGKSYSLDNTLSGITGKINTFKTYKDALEKGLEEALKLIP